MTFSKPEIKIFNATESDLQLVSNCILAAVDLYDFAEPSVESEIAVKVCGTPGTLYYYENARVAVIDGVPVGAIISYDGSSYAEAREKTFAMFKESGHEMPQTDMETGPGEWYLDSMAVLPNFRGYGIGLMLMRDALELARERGISKASLLVEKDKTGLRDYYASLGFKPECELQAFGGVYTRMTLDLQ